MGKGRIDIPLNHSPNSSSIAVSLAGRTGALSGEEYSRALCAFLGDCPGQLSFALARSRDKTDASDSGHHGVGVWRNDVEKSVRRIAQLSAAHTFCGHGHDSLGEIAAVGKSVRFRPKRLPRVYSLPGTTPGYSPRQEFGSGAFGFGAGIGLGHLHSNRHSHAN